VKITCKIEVSNTEEGLYSSHTSIWEEDPQANGHPSHGYMIGFCTAECVAAVMGSVHCTTENFSDDITAAIASRIAEYFSDEE